MCFFNLSRSALLLLWSFNTIFNNKHCLVHLSSVSVEAPVWTGSGQWSVPRTLTQLVYILQYLCVVLNHKFILQSVHFMNIVIQIALNQYTCWTSNFESFYLINIHSCRMLLFLYNIMDGTFKRIQSKVLKPFLIDPISWPIFAAIFLNELTDDSSAIQSPPTQ